MDINERLNKIIILLSEKLETVSVIKAYPDRRIQSKLTEKTIAVGIEETTVYSSGIDDNERNGDFGIYIDIFIPISYDSGEALVVFEKICKALSVFNVISVSAGRVEFDSVLSAYVLKSAVRFNGLKMLGGADYEQ